MRKKYDDKLIKLRVSPKGIIYKISLIYTILAFISILSGLIIIRDRFFFEPYFFLTTMIVFSLLIILRKTYKIKNDVKGLCLFKVALFLLINSSLITLAGWGGIIDRQLSSLMATILYSPSMLIFILTSESFVEFVNKKYDEVRNESLLDELTGIPNRRFLNELTEKYANSFAAVCIADLDDFKSINDNYGHDCGDRALKEFAGYLIGYCDEITYVIRLGGEEFIIVTLNNFEYISLFEKIYKNFGSKELACVKFTVSYGIAVKNFKSSFVETIARADKALYVAKKNGKNRMEISNDFDGI